jgi:gamma-glutamyltranspeptidase
MTNSLYGSQALGSERAAIRFGKLPFSTPFGPAIWIAENGVVVSPVVNAWITQATQNR